MTGRRRAKTIAGSLALPFLVVAPLLFGETNSQPLEPEPSRDHPLLKIDLRRHGYTRHGRDIFDSLSLAFTDGNDIRVAWNNCG
jgi:hypothetical protein